APLGRGVLHHRQLHRRRGREVAAERPAFRFVLCFLSPLNIAYAGCVFQTGLSAGAPTVTWSVEKRNRGAQSSAASWQGFQPERETECHSHFKRPASFRPNRGFQLRLVSSLLLARGFSPTFSTGSWGACLC